MLVVDFVKSISLSVMDTSSGYRRVDLLKVKGQDGRKPAARCRVFGRYCGDETRLLKSPDTFQGGKPRVARQSNQESNDNQQA